MISGIKDMIARCMERMRGGACATCDNRAVCPAGRWKQAFGPPSTSRNFFEIVGNVFAGLSQRQDKGRCFKREVEEAIEPLLLAGEVSVDRVARQLGMSRQTLY